MQSRTAAALVVVAVAVSGCSAGTTAQQGRSTAAVAPAVPDAIPAASVRPLPPDLLVVRAARGARVINASTGAVVASVQDGVPAPGGTPLVGTTPTGVSLVDAVSGVASTLTGGAPLVPAVATRDAQLVALSAPAGAAIAGYIAPARTHSRITVTGSEGPAARSYDLPGNFEPEAFSTDRTQLFLIEYLPAAAPDRYRVRQLDLASGTVDGVFGPNKQLLDEQMRGVGRMQLLDDRNAVLYTLYRTVGSDQAFVHTLHLSDRWAHCIVLPAEFGRGGADVAIALAPDGTLYAWDGRTIATVRAETMEIGPTAVVHPQSPNGAVSAAVAPDGTVVTVAGDAVAELDAGSFAPTAAWSLPAPASSVAMSTDGRTLYAVAGAQIIAVDRASHTEIGRVAAAPGDRIAAVLQQP